MAKLVLEISVYDDGTMVLKTQEQEVKSVNNPETLMTMLLIGVAGSLGGRR